MKILQVYDGIYSKADGITAVIEAQSPLLDELLHGELVELSFGESRDLTRAGWISFIQSLYRNRDADFLIFHGYYKLQIIPSFLICKLWSVRFVLVPHGAFTKMSRGKSRVKKAIFHALIGKWVVRGSHFVRFLNNAEKNSSFVCPQRVKILPNGIDMPQRLEAESRYADLEGDGANLIFLGRLDIQHKGLDRLVDLAASMLDQSDALKFRIEIYGSDNKAEQSRLGELITASNLNSIVSICGPVYGKDKESVFRRAHAFVLLSRYEGMPLAFLEAVSYGIPCVVTKETNIADLVSDYDCGLVIDSFGSETSAKIWEMLSSRDRLEEMSSSAFDLAQSCFDWSGIVSNLVIQLEESMSS